MLRLFFIIFVSSLSIYCFCDSSQENERITSVKGTLEYKYNPTMDQSGVVPGQSQGHFWVRRLFSSICVYLLIGSVTGADQDQICNSQKADSFSYPLTSDMAVIPDFCSDFGFSYKGKWVFDELLLAGKKGVQNLALVTYDIPKKRNSWKNGFDLGKKGMIEDPDDIEPYLLYKDGEVVIPLEYHVFSTPECEGKGFKYRLLENNYRVADSRRVNCYKMGYSSQIHGVNTEDLSKIWYQTREEQRRITFSWTHGCVVGSKGGEEFYSVNPGPKSVFCVLEAQHFGFCEQEGKVRQIIDLYCNKYKLDKKIVLEDREFDIDTYRLTLPQYMGNRYFEINKENNEPLVSYAAPGKDDDFRNNWECLQVKEGNKISACKLDGALNAGWYHPPCLTSLEIQHD